MRGSPRKGRTRYDDGAFDDEETEDEETEDEKEKEVVKIDRDLSNFFLYECGCGQRFIINGMETNLLSTHRKICNIKVYRRDDEYPFIVKFYKINKTKELVKGFNVFWGSLNKIVDWLQNDGFTEEQILEVLKYTKYNKDTIRANLRDFYGRLLLDDEL